MEEGSGEGVGRQLSDLKISRNSLHRIRMLSYVRYGNIPSRVALSHEHIFKIVDYLGFKCIFKYYVIVSP